VPEEMIRQLLAAAPDIIKLDRQVTESFVWLWREYRYIKQAPAHAQHVYQELRSQLKNTKKGFKTEIDDVYRKNYFYQVHNVMIKRQL
jgi:hypothetical protein